MITNKNILKEKQFWIYIISIFALLFIVLLLPKDSTPYSYYCGNGRGSFCIKFIKGTEKLDNYNCLIQNETRLCEYRKVY